MGKQLGTITRFVGANVNLWPDEIGIYKLIFNFFGSTSCFRIGSELCVDDPTRCVDRKLARRIFEFICGDQGRSFKFIPTDDELAHFAEDLKIVSVDPKSPVEARTRILYVAELEIIFQDRGYARSVGKGIISLSLI